MDSQIILQPKQMGQSLMGFFPLFFTLMSTKHKENVVDQTTLENIQLPQYMFLLAS